ncbi:hypothetical protein E5A73_08690 [Sphingomonas gei]|uniref:Uncharacterized protein n=2 Tax=Sphingomonas gei TaxID=1395960 RepID=A0A4S1XH84_9SPHN|nr:hypothetical protein E5A73_08690 [Sphingomonas gei]
MRVVKDPSGSDRRRGNAVTADEAANSFEVVGGAGTVGAAPTAAATDQGSLPLLPAALFLLACVAGGVLVAVMRPMGLG